MHLTLPRKIFKTSTLLFYGICYSALLIMHLTNLSHSNPLLILFVHVLVIYYANVRYDIHTWDIKFLGVKFLVYKVLDKR